MTARIFHADHVLPGDAPPITDGALEAAKARALEAEAASAALRAESQKAQQQLRDLQSRLTTRDAELQAARGETDKLRDEVSKARGPGEAGNLRCPRCGAHMTEYEHDVVRADRCDACGGIFFDKGELEALFHVARLIQTAFADR